MGKERVKCPKWDTIFFRLAGDETHEFRVKVKRNVPGGAVAVFGEVKAGLSGEWLPLVLVLGVVVGTVKQAYQDVYKRQPRTAPKRFP